MSKRACNTCGEFHPPGSECTPSPLMDAMNKLWGLLYPTGPTSWDYPGQVVNHIRIALQERADKLAIFDSLPKLADGVAQESEKPS